MGRTNLSGNLSNKESYRYYSQSFSANKSYYMKMGYTDLIPVKMTKQEWEYRRRTNPNQSNAELIYSEFHKYSKEQSQILKERLSRSGIKLPAAKVARGDLTTSGWNVIKSYYHELKENGMTGKEAAATISYEFWGSP